MRDGGDSRGRGSRGEVYWVITGREYWEREIEEEYWVITGREYWERERDRGRVLGHHWERVL